MAQQQQQQHQHQHQHQQLLSGMWPWSGHRPEDTDDSWEVRTFSTEDTKSSYLTTWPPRSYTCSFCRREFRSAQALGGHMNVHRRDRAKLHQSPVVSNPSSPPLPPLVISNGGMRLFYPLPLPSAAIFAPAPSTVLSMSPCSTTGTDPVASLNESPAKSDSSASSTSTEELDLELRLGW